VRDRTPSCIRLSASSLFVLLLVSACGGDSTAPSNFSPTAVADVDQLVSVGSVVSLDASASLDADGDALTFAWTLTAPTGSAASLSSASAAMSTFTADIAGTYTVGLTVSDGAVSVDETILVAAVAAHCDALVDLFPTPVRASSSPFANTDDAFINVAFNASYDFTFYGQTYDAVFLNSNGGMTFGSGLPVFDPEVSLVDVPTIAPFWGDMDALEAKDRPGQMVYEACSDRFIVYYLGLQDLDVATWNNTATVTLFSDGTITFEYGTVGSRDIMVGIFDGTHVSDDYVSVQTSYTDYAASTGTILFDDFGVGPGHTGELSNQTITFDPAP